MHEQARLAQVIFLAGVFLFGVPALGEVQVPAELAAKHEQARQALSAGRFQEAVALYREVEQALPELAGPKLNLGMAYYLAGQYPQAVEKLEAALSQDPALTRGWLFLGASYLQMGEAAKALGPLKRSVQAEPRNLQARQMLGDACLAAEDFWAALEQFQELVQLDSELPRAWYGLGRAYEGLAQASFQELEEKAPESAYWFALVADARMAEQQYRSAFYLYRQALERDPHLRGIHVALSRIYRSTGKPEQWAVQEEEREMELGVPDCQQEPLVCAFLEGRFQQLLEAAQKEGGTPRSLFWQCRAYNQLATAAFAKLAQLPPSLELHQLLAEIHMTQGRYRDAAGEWKKALELAPEQEEIRQELALALYLSRDYEGARPLVDQLLARRPGSPQLNFLAGDILLNQERAREAVPFLLKALEADPQLIPAHASLGRAYLNLGEHARAIPHLESALVSDRDGSLHYQLARAYQSSGQGEQARQTLQKYQQLQRKLQEEQAQLQEEVEITPP